MEVSQKIWGTTLGVPIIKIIVFWGLYWGPLNSPGHDIRRSGNPDLVVLGVGAGGCSFGSKAVSGLGLRVWVYAEG